MPRKKIVGSGPGRKGVRCAPDDKSNQAYLCVESRESGEGVMECTTVAGLKVPSLKNRKIKIAGKVPRLSSVELRPKETIGEEPPVAAVETKPHPEPLQKTEPPVRDLIKVVPTPTKKERKPKRARMTPLEPAVPKPLKVIRRRREEAPKIFETPPKIVPKAMLEGIDLDSDTDAEN